jgi:hypothetical protein
MTQQPPDGPYGNDPYAAQYQQGPPPKRGKGLAISALVLGILALLLSWTVLGGILFGLIAVVLGLVASSKAKKGRAGGRGMAIAGIVLGVVGIVIAGALIALGASFLNSEEGQRLQDCLDEAGQDQAAIEQCNDRFGDDLMDRFGG